MQNKKIIIGIVIIILVIVACSTVVIFSLKNNETSKKKKEQTSTPTPTNNVEEEENEIEIKKVIEKFDKGLALVEDEDEKQYVINEKGKIIYEQEDDEEIFINNGYISAGHYIYDSKGKEVAHNDNKIYNKVSKSEYVLVTIEINNVTGTKYMNQIEDLKGNKVSEQYLTYSDFDSDRYLFEDFYLIYDREKEDNVILDANKNEAKYAEEFENRFLETTLSTVRKYGEWYCVRSAKGFNWFVNSDFSKIIYEKINVDNEEYTYKQVILDKYMLAESNQGKVALFNTEGNMIADLTENGGVKDIKAFEDVIYILSDKYLYTVNSDLEYIVEPKKTDFSGLALTKEGVWGVGTNKGKEKLVLLDEKTEEKAEMSDVEDWNLKNIIKEQSSDGSKFIYAIEEEELPSEVNFIYNTDTEEMMKILKE